MLDVHRARRLALIALVMGLLLIQPLDVSALTASEAKQAWMAAREVSVLLLLYQKTRPLPSTDIVASNLLH